MLFAGFASASRRRAGALGARRRVTRGLVFFPRGAMRRLEICSALSLAQMEVLSEACDFARTVAQQAGRAKPLGCFLVLLHDASSVQRGTVLAVCYASLSRAAEPWLGHFDTEP